MEFSSPRAGLFVRLIALVSLLLGLNDAGRLLGVQLGATSPIEALGMTGFVYLAIFALARLFAAVGLWIRASWGAVLLAGATAVELALYLSGSADVQMTMLGFAVRVALVGAILVIFGLHLHAMRLRAAD